MRDNFDLVLQKGGVRYGILRGGSTIVLIKSGCGGSCRGTGDRRLKMARRLWQQGFSVICATNPCGCDSTLAADEKILRQYAAEQNFSDFDLYLIGTSDGADHNLKLARHFPQTKKLLAINPSSVSPEDQQEKLRLLPQVEKYFVYGTKDEEFPQGERLQTADIPNLWVFFTEGADHRFTGMPDAYIAQADLLWEKAR